MEINTLFWQTWSNTNHLSKNTMKNDALSALFAEPGVMQHFADFLQKSMYDGSLTPLEISRSTNLHTKTVDLYLKGESTKAIQHLTYKKLLAGVNSDHSKFVSYLQQQGIAIDTIAIGNTKSQIKDNSVSTSGVTIQGDVKVKGNAIGVVKGDVTFNQ